MNVPAEIPWHIRVRVLGTVRHANILRSIMNVYLRNNRIEAIVPVMVAFDENKLAIQPLFELTIFLYSPFFPAFKDEVAQKENCIVRLDSLIVLSDDRFIHFLSRLKRPLAISDDIEVRKVIIRCPPVVHYSILLISSSAVFNFFKTLSKDGGSSKNISFICL